MCVELVIALYVNQEENFVENALINIAYRQHYEDVFYFRTSTELRDDNNIDKLSIHVLIETDMVVEG